MTMVNVHAPRPVKTPEQEAEETRLATVRSLQETHTSILRNLLKQIEAAVKESGASTDLSRLRQQITDEIAVRGGRETPTYIRDVSRAVNDIITGIPKPKWVNGAGRDKLVYEAACILAEIETIDHIEPSYGSTAKPAGKPCKCGKGIDTDGDSNCPVCAPLEGRIVPDPAERES
jgi:hypothetical protein